MSNAKQPKSSLGRLIALLAIIIALFLAMRFLPVQQWLRSFNDWVGQMGTREAIRRDGLEIDPASLAYCPHEWINDEGYVDIDLVRKFPSLVAL